MPSEPRTIYAVSEGSYSDYRVVALFSTKEGAKAYIADCDGNSRYGGDKMVEEYELDLPREELPGCYQVEIDASGTVIDSEWSNYSRASEAAQHFPNSRPPMYRGYGMTVEHARRSAEELRRVTLTSPPHAS